MMDDVYCVVDCCPELATETRPSGMIDGIPVEECVCAAHLFESYDAG